jgi:hypothetical protein
MTRIARRLAPGVLELGALRLRRCTARMERIRAGALAGANAKCHPGEWTQHHTKTSGGSLETVMHRPRSARSSASLRSRCDQLQMR